MPELPEVETTRRGIAPHLQGQRVTRLVVRERRLRWPIPEDLAIQIEGQCFEAIERVWEQEKSKYTRVYFLTQKLLLQEICPRLRIPSTQPTKRPISDIRRYRAQIRIFEDLWKIVICNKCLSPASSCTLGTNSHSHSSPRTPNSLWRTAFSV